MWLIADLMDKASLEFFLEHPARATLNFIEFWWMWWAFAGMVYGMVKFMKWSIRQEQESQDRKYNRQIRRDCR